MYMVCIAMDLWVRVRDGECNLGIPKVHDLLFTYLCYKQFHRCFHNHTRLTAWHYSTSRTHIHSLQTLPIYVHQTARISTRAAANTCPAQTIDIYARTHRHCASFDTDITRPSE